MAQNEGENPILDAPFRSKNTYDPLAEILRERLLAEASVYLPTVYLELRSRVVAEIS
jgi:hypothetical protein